MPHQIAFGPSINIGKGKGIGNGEMERKVPLIHFILRRIVGLALGQKLGIVFHFSVMICDTGFPQVPAVDF